MIVLFYGEIFAENAENRIALVSGGIRQDGDGSYCQPCVTRRKQDYVLILGMVR